MNNPKQLPALTLALVLILLTAACAHQPAEPAPEQAGAPQASDSASPASPETERKADLRYQLPTAGARALNIYLSSQTFDYVEDDRVIASGSVSSGSKEHPTPAGTFKILSKQRDKRSGKYTNYFDENTPMPFSLQFHGPYFVHEGWLPGFADSHGCVRLHYDDAKFLFSRMKVGDVIRVKPQGKARPADPWSGLFPVF